jgi:hypothetical protein
MQMVSIRPTRPAIFVRKACLTLGDTPGHTPGQAMLTGRVGRGFHPGRHQAIIGMESGPLKRWRFALRGD